MEQPEIDNLFFNKLVKAFAAVGCLLVLLAMVLVCLDVIYNLVGGRTLSWVTEIVEYSLLWMTFLGSAWVLKNDAHIKMEIVVHKLTHRMGRFLNMVTSYFGAIVCFILTYSSLRVTIQSIKTGYRLMTYLETPAAAINFVIPIGFALIGLVFVQKGNYFARGLKQK